MSLFLKHEEKKLQWGIWKTGESVEELLALLPEQKKYEQAIQCFTSVHRRVEWLSVRVLLYKLLGEEKEIIYLPTGKPYLSEPSRYISISHTRGYVAVILSQIAEVSVDIEQFGERVRRITSRFMREDELPSLYSGSETWSLLLHWSAKEVMFKCMNADNVDFRKHLQVYPFQVQDNGTFRAKEYRTSKQQEFMISYFVHSDFVMTWQIAE